MDIYIAWRSCCVCLFQANISNRNIFADRITISIYFRRWSNIQSEQKFHTSAVATISNKPEEPKEPGPFDYLIDTAGVEDFWKKSMANNPMLKMGMLEKDKAIL